MASETGRRVAVAAVGVPIALGAVYLGGVVLAVLLALIAWLGFREYARLLVAKGARPLVNLGALASATAVLAVAWAGSPHPIGYWLIIAVITVSAASIWARGVEGGPLHAVSATIAGAAYTGVALSFGYLLRHLPGVDTAAAGTAILFFPVLLTWVNDSAAYFGGRAFGSRKLIPKVSPGKTVEGALIGVAGTVLVAAAYVPLLDAVAGIRLDLWFALLFGLIVAVAAQVGDLFESAIKRDAGVKDSGTLLPGHGGVLDRFDSLFFVLPIAYMLLRLLEVG